MKAAWILFLVVSLEARILHVPQEYGTIQIALDNLQDEDTVLVDAGIYVESLSAPNQLSFTLAGNISDSSGRPVLDATLIPGSDTLALLSLSGNLDVKIRDVVFRNGPEMRNNREWPYLSGGIINSASFLTLENCYFDSVSYAISSVDNLTINLCEFIGSVNRIVNTNFGTVKAYDCVFDGTGSDDLVQSGHDSEYRRCFFRSNAFGRLLRMSGHNLTVDSCGFGPFSRPSPALLLTPLSHCEITNNVFHDCASAWGLIYADPDCDVSAEFPLILIQDNLFVRNSPFSGTQDQTITIDCREGIYRAARIKGNIFDSTSVNPSAGSRAIESNAMDLIEGNEFRHLEPLAVPAILVYNSEDGDGNQAALHSNRFLPEGLAVQNSGLMLDAEFNWWGHITGPYHPVLNPLGLGAEVSNNVDFEPWLEDSIVSAVPEQNPEALSYSITAFPNPFNASTTIRYDLKMAGHTVLKVYNVIGHEVATLVNETQNAGAHTILFATENLSSGIYFCRLISGNAVKTSKMVLMK